MTINQFLNHRKHCLVCNQKLIITMSGQMNEMISFEPVNSAYAYMIPAVRKDFLTFGLFNSTVIAHSYNLDMDTFDAEKYGTFILRSDGYVSFDKDFQYKMKMTFSATCPYGHYSYNSRLVRVSNKSPDITKGFPVVSEDVYCDKYKVSSNIVDRKTSIYNLDKSKEPTIIPYMNVEDFPYDNKDNFIKKIENMLMLG